MTDAEEARAILLAAGADPDAVRVEQTSIGWLVAWRGVGAGATDQTNQTMDTPQEVALAIVAALPKNSAAPPSRTPSAASEPASDDIPPSDAGALAEPEEAVETPQYESDGETGEEAETEADAPAVDSSRAAEELLGGDDASAFEDDPGPERSLGEGAADSIMDADFTVEDLGADELADDTDFDTLALERADAEPEAPAQDGPIAYGASTIDGLIREKLGRVSQIARELKAVQQDGWTVEEYAYLQNLIVRMDRGEAPDDQASRERFLAIAAKSQAMSRIDSVRDRKEGELEEIGQRRDFDAAVYYEPEAGWPA